MLFACTDSGATSNPDLHDEDSDIDQAGSSSINHGDEDPDENREQSSGEDDTEIPDEDSETERNEANEYDLDPEMEEVQDIEETEVEPELPCENMQIFYRDRDGDGFGNPDECVELCELEAGFVEDHTDCHDDDGTAYPGSHEKETPFDGIDQDCDGHDYCDDANCDGWPDLVFAQTDNNGDYFTDSYVYLGKGTRYENPERWSIPTIGAMGVEAVDFNKDGYIDFAFASIREGSDSAEQAHTLSLVYYGTGEGVLLDSCVELPTIGCSDVRAADVDGDGWIDLVFTNRFAGKPHSILNPQDYELDSVIYLNSSSGFSPIHKIELPTVGAARSRIADLNNDGFMDIIFANGVLQMIGDESYIYWGDQFGWSTSNRTSLKTQFPEGLLVADITGNGRLDILFTSWMCVLCQGTYLYENTPNGIDDDHRLVIDGANGATDAKFKDLDGDGYGDLILANGAFGADESYIYWGPEFAENSRTALPVSTSSEVSIGDLDLDGYTDLVFSNHPIEMKNAESSIIFWGSAEGYSRGDGRALPTVHAAGVKIIGAIEERQ